MGRNLHHLVEKTSQVFLPGGPLASVLPGYETRSEQIRLAELIAQTITGEDRLLAEAGTGTGKSLAYLVPILLAVGDGRRAVISTHTINLQDQLFNKDIPLAQKASGVKELKVERVLGRNNYLCRRKLITGNPDLFSVSDSNWEKLLAFSDCDPEGIRGNLSFKVPFWEKIASRTMDCPGPNCSEYRQCFYQSARKREREADLLIVNHALLAADLILRRSGGSRLEDFEILVVDEAHALPAVAVDAFGYTYSLAMMLALLDQLLPAHSGGGALHWELLSDRRNDLNRQTLSLRNAAHEQHRSLLAIRNNKQGRINERYYVQNLISEPSNNLLTLLSILASGANSPQKEEVLGVIWQLQQLNAALEINLSHDLPRYVYYAEGIDESYALIAKPLDVSETLGKELWDKCKTSIAVSATLAVGGSLGFNQKRLGMGDVVTEIIPGGFDYEQQLMIYVPRDLPDPNHEEFDVAVAKKIIDLAEITSGGLLCLFTSYRALEGTHLATVNDLERLGYLVFKQNDAPRDKLVRKMREHGRIALFGTASFWEGIDVPGEALSSLAICRLPFSPPDDPYEEAMRDLITDRGGNHFMDWSVPQAVMRLRQGVGRLIRRRDDYGIVAIFDSRLHHKTYGRIFLKSLPPGKLVDDLTESCFITKPKRCRRRKKREL